MQRQKLTNRWPPKMHRMFAIFSLHFTSGTSVQMQSTNPNHWRRTPACHYYLLPWQYGTITHCSTLQRCRDNGTQSFWTLQPSERSRAWIEHGGDEFIRRSSTGAAPASSQARHHRVSPALLAPPRTLAFRFSGAPAVCTGVTLSLPNMLSSPGCAVASPSFSSLLLRLMHQPWLLSGTMQCDANWTYMAVEWWASPCPDDVHAYAKKNVLRSSAVKLVHLGCSSLGQLPLQCSQVGRYRLICSAPTLMNCHSLFLSRPFGDCLVDHVNFHDLITDDRWDIYANRVECQALILFIHPPLGQTAVFTSRSDMSWYVWAAHFS